MIRMLSIFAIVLAIALPLLDLAIFRPRRAVSGTCRRGECAIYLLFLVAVALMTVSSILMLALGRPMHGWMLMLHMSAAPIFAISVAALAVIWADRASVLISVVLLSALVTIATAMLGMMSWFGSDWQRTLLQLHRISAMILLVAAAIQAGRTLAADRAKAVDG